MSALDTGFRKARTMVLEAANTLEKLEHARDVTTDMQQQAMNNVENLDRLLDDLVNATKDE
eukprot:gene13425-3924_t